MPSEPLLVVNGATKSFFGNVVLRDVALDLRGGEIHALVGENGAGKSTLVNIISGNLRPDKAEIRFADGSSYPHISPRLAKSYGIAVVHQELSLAPHLSVAENVALGATPRWGPLVHYGRLASQTARLFEQLEFDIPLDEPVRELPLGMQQLVEIAKALFRDPAVLILDEPTSSLTAHEVELLTKVLFRLREQGKALLFISHRLGEVMGISDRVSALKDGVKTATMETKGLDEQRVVRLMVGRDPGEIFPDRVAPAGMGEPVMQVEGLRSGILGGVDLTLRRGEILGIGGLLGQGQDELLRALFGAVPHSAKAYLVDGRPTKLHSPLDALKNGIAYVPADRKVEGLLLPMSIAVNLTLPGLRGFANRGVRRPAVEWQASHELFRDYNIRGGRPDDVAAYLSGGNQQKVAMAKWMPLQPKILLLNDPTRGVDIGTKREFYLKLTHLAAQGTSIVWLSSETVELVHVASRVLVMYEGRVGAEIAAADLSEESIVAAAVGSSPAGQGRKGLT